MKLPGPRPNPAWRRAKPYPAAGCLAFHGRNNAMSNMLPAIRATDSGLPSSMARRTRSSRGYAGDRS
jgi:hypothetical protein